MTLFTGNTQIPPRVDLGPMGKIHQRTITGRELVPLFNWGQLPFGLTTIMTVMLMKQFKIEGMVNELRSQGLTVTQHSASNETWFIKGDGIYLGYVATGDELIELKRINRLSLLGIKSLG